MKDISGLRFGKLVAVSPRRKKGITRWLCYCDCGGVAWVRLGQFSNGKTTSCGCKVGKTAKHGMTFTPEFKAWSTMRQRCANSKNDSYPYYGGRGINVCPEWNKFEDFFKDMGLRPSNKHSLDRSNSNGDYDPSNCRGITMAEQQRNKRSNVYVIY